MEKRNLIGVLGGVAIVRMLAGLAIISILSIGGVIRHKNHTPVPFFMEQQVSDSEVMRLSGWFHKKELKGLEYDSPENLGLVVSKKYIVITTPLESWNPALKIKAPALYGETMGTSFSVKLSDSALPAEVQELNASVFSELLEINRQMSTWDPMSEISKFNASPSLEGFQCSEAFAQVVRRSLSLSKSTGGAFDPTLQPLLNLWGFGSGGEERRVPGDEEILAVRQTTGWDKLRVDDSSKLWKTEPELSLALGAIAKGYGVDALAALLNNHGHRNWFVEIGGEVVVRGKNPEGNPWKIGIQHPSTNPMNYRIQGIVHLTNGAVATSGDYRNYISEGDVVYSHILDPRTGQAVRSELAGVTVVASHCMDADGIATALFVMGAEDGLKWIETQADTEALFLVRTPSGEINEKFSSGFRKAARYTSSH